MLQDPLSLLSSQLDALSHTNRLSIVKVLREKGPMITKDIGDSIGIVESLVTHHLRQLYHAELVANSREGHTKLYYVNELKVEEFLSNLTLFLKGPTNADSGSTNSSTEENPTLRPTEVRQVSPLHDPGKGSSDDLS